MLSKNQKRKLLLDEVYVYSLVTRAYNEGFAKPYSESALQHPYSKRLLEIGSDTELQKEVLVYLILYDELHFPGFDNFVLLDKNGKQLYPESRDKDEVPLHFDVRQCIIILPQLSLFLELCCKDACNGFLSLIHEESEHLKRIPTSCFLTYVNMYSLNEIKLEYNEFKVNYCEPCTNLYGKIINLLQNLNCDKFRYEVETLLEYCTQYLRPNDFSEELEARMRCGLAIYNLIEEKLPEDIVKTYYKCQHLYASSSRVRGLIENATKNGLDIKIGSLRKIKHKLYRIEIKELNNLRALIKEEHVDEACVSMLAFIVLDKVPWIKPVTYRYALELLGKESISAFREWFWSSVNELLTSDSGENISRIVNEVEKGVNEILNTKDLKYRLEKYGKVTLLLSLPLSIASIFIPSTSIIGLGVSLLSATPEITWYIERNKIKRKYSWLMPDAVI